MTTGEKIKAARIERGLTQAELATRLNLPYQSIGQWERGVRTPKRDTLQKIADALGVEWYHLCEDNLAELFLPQELMGGYIERVDEETLRYMAEQLDNLEQREKKHYIKAKRDILAVALRSGLSDVLLEYHHYDENNIIAAKFLRFLEVNGMTLLNKKGYTVVDGSDFQKWCLEGERATMFGLVSLDRCAFEMLEAYSNLNGEGKKVAADRVKELCEISRYAQIERGRENQWQENQRPEASDSGQTDDGKPE